MIDRRLKVFAASAAGLALAAMLPLEETVVGSLNPWFVMAKSTLAFTALIVPVAGVGALVVEALRRIGAGSAGTPAIATAIPLHLVAAALVGVVMIGLGTFAVGLLVKPSLALGLIVASAAYVAAWVAFRAGSPYAVALATARDGALANFRALERSERVAWLIVAGVFLVKLVPAYMYQQHGDPYSYTVSASDRWLRMGTTGLDLADIHTGYALACEHYFLFLKLLLTGHTEQYVVGTLTSVCFGYGTFVLSLLTLARRLMPSRAVPLVAAFLLQTTFTYIAWQPRNDASLAGLGMLGLAAFVLELDGLFFAAAAGVFIVKAPGPIVFVAIGLTTTAFARHYYARTRWHATLRTLAIGAILMVLVWAPFALYNFLKTGNPLFPLANEVFRSPFAPIDFSDVIDDMAPLTLTLAGFVRGLWRMVSTHPLYLAGLATLLVAPLWRPLRREAVDLARQAPFQFLAVFLPVVGYLLQAATREYTPDFASRHVLAFFGPLAVVSLAVLARLGSLGPLRRWLTWVLFPLCLSQAHLEVAVQQAWRFAATPNQTADIQSRHPILKLTSFLDRYVADRRLEGARVVSVANNLSYFLTNAEFWHETKTYPMWSWPQARMTSGDWRDKIERHRLGFAIVGPQEPAVNERIEALPHERLLTTGEYRLLRFR